MTENNDRQNDGFKFIFMVTADFYRYMHRHIWCALKGHRALAEGWKKMWKPNEKWKTDSVSFFFL